MRLNKMVISGMLCLSMWGNSAFAAPVEDIEGLIQNQQNILNQLNSKKMQQQDEKNQKRIDTLELQLRDLKNNLNKYDSEGAINALAAQLSILQKNLEQQRSQQNEIMNSLKDIKEKEILSINSPQFSPTISTVPTKKYLVNPGPAQNVGYTQDAINAQGDSTMIFAYSPEQVYKIYCKVGYLTDLQFKKGEEITYVGGGNTAQWTIDKSDVAGTPHLYIKPLHQSVTTNLIVNTTQHSYQIIANSGDWYNPMIAWSYGAEDQIMAQLQTQKDAAIYTDKLNINSPDELNFGYAIKGNEDWKPIMVFDDGQKTYIQFKKALKKAPVLFIKEANKKVALVNYRVKDNYYIVDKIFMEAQLRVSDKEIIKIVAER